MLFYAYASNFLSNFDSHHNAHPYSSFSELVLNNHGKFIAEFTGRIILNILICHSHCDLKKVFLVSEFSQPTILFNPKI